MAKEAWSQVNLPALEFQRREMADGTVMRTLTPDDAKSLVLAINDPVVRRWLPIPPVYDESVAHGWCSETTVQMRERGTGLVLGLARGATIVGSVDIKRIDWRAGSAEMSYWVTSAYAGRGIATRAAELMSRWLLLSLDFNRCELRIARGNEASAQVARGSGFVHEGTARQAGFLPEGQVIDLEIWSRIRAEVG